MNLVPDSFTRLARFLGYRILAYPGAGYVLTDTDGTLLTPPCDLLGLADRLDFAAFVWRDLASL